MVRLLLEDVTLIRGENITLHLRFKGGATNLKLPRPLTAWELRPTRRKWWPPSIGSPTINGRRSSEVLNERGAAVWGRSSLQRRIVARLRREYEITPGYRRLRGKGLLTVDEMSLRWDSSTANTSTSGETTVCSAATPSMSETIASTSIRARHHHGRPQG